MMTRLARPVAAALLGLWLWGPLAPAAAQGDRQEGRVSAPDAVSAALAWVGGPAGQRLEIIAQAADPETPATGGRWFVVVNRRGFLDDSVQADHHALTIRSVGDGQWQVFVREHTVQCQPGRGPDDGFHAGPCR